MSKQYFVCKGINNPADNKEKSPKNNRWMSVTGGRTWYEENLLDNFWNLLQFCHRPFEMPLNAGIPWWWQNRLWWQQIAKIRIFFALPSRLFRICSRLS